MKKAELLKIIKEEVEVVLTDAEMIEMFDLDPSKLLDEMMSEVSREEGGMDAISMADQEGAVAPPAEKRTSRQDRVQKQLDKGGMKVPLEKIRALLDTVPSEMKKADMFLKVIFPALGLGSSLEDIVAFSNKLRTQARKI